VELRAKIPTLRETDVIVDSRNNIICLDGKEYDTPKDVIDMFGDLLEEVMVLREMVEHLGHPDNVYEIN
tara:strand:+ start:2051 stop:2257 length:207 start_codon:yes stop_codon:yes gene_type:complete